MMEKSETKHGKTVDAIVSPCDIRKYCQDIASQPSATLGVPVVWSEYVYDQDMVYTKENTVPGGLNQNVLPAIGLNLFEHNPNVFLTTLKELGHSDGSNLTMIRNWRIQFGYFAYILMTEAVLGEQSVFFTTTLSRKAEGSFSAAQIYRDYCGLRSLAARFNLRLKPEHKSKYSAVRPTANGMVVYGDQIFPYYTAPFVPFGELGVSVQEVIKNGRLHTFFPYFGYALPYNKAMEQANKEAVNAAKKRASVFIANYPNPDLSMLNALEETKSYSSQRHDLLLGECILYLLLDNQLPEHHEIRSGDWMAIIAPNSLTMKLITLRGELRNLSLGELYSLLRNRTEPVVMNRALPSLGTKKLVRYDILPFEDLKTLEFNQLIQEAQSMIR